MAEQAQLTDKVTGAPKRTVEQFQLPSKSVTTPAGVGVVVTASPHRDGNPDHDFYEAWFNWEGGTLRSSTVIHDRDTREAVLELLYQLTGVDQDVAVSGALDKYDWHATE